jgi:hypothetical protein
VDGLTAWFLVGFSTWHVHQQWGGGGGRQHLLNNAINGFDHNGTMVRGGLDTWLLGGINCVLLKTK